MGLVDFVIGGAAKSGTTSLYEYFQEHPEVCMSRPKEPNYFTMHYGEEKTWYVNKFDHCEENELRGEASTSYLEFSGQAAIRLQGDVPNVQLIFVLRDPVERAFSDYWFAVRQGRIKHREGLFDDLVRGEVDFPDYWHPQCNTGELIVERGKYAEKLNVFRDHFEADQIKVLLTEELSDDGYERVTDFLGIPPSPQPSETKENVGRYPTSTGMYAVYKVGRRVLNALPQGVNDSLAGIKRRVRKAFFRGERPEMKSDTRRYLREVYRESNRELEKLIGRDLSHWQ